MQDLIIGGTAAVVSRTLTAPLELYKIQAQNRYLKGSTMRNVVKKEGFRYLWKGNGVNCARAFPQFAINYALFEYSRENIANNIVKNETMKNFIAGGLSGIGSMMCIYPLETVRTRLSLQMCNSHYTTPYNALKNIPIRQLYGGLGMSLLGFGPFSALNFSFFHLYKDLFTQLGMDSTSNKLLSGGLGAVSAVSITYPTDLIRKRLQMQGFDDSVPKYTGIIDCVRKLYNIGGYKELYRGLLPTYIRLFPCFAIQFWCLETGKQLTYIKI
jgi:solute carrier family 25 phosphate transporter 23/24/25/41|tara:strand:+ start:1145 stop:1954 length:810 start_codon:yes stop_codon:yes gene_type:complete